MNINENDLGDRMATGISYGTSGIVNPGVSTYSSPDVSQHPIDFYPVGQNKIDSYNSMRATGPDQKDIDSVKNKVTPDEVLCGLEYELKRMFYKNKSHAKQMVVDNLKKDPKYYSKLHMLNINDEFIKENTSIEDDIVDLELLLKNPDVEFAKKNYGSVDAYKKMIQQKIDKLKHNKIEEVTEDRYQKIDEEKKKAFEDIFSNIKHKNKILSNRNVDERVINAYKQTEEKLKNKRNHGS